MLYVKIQNGEVVAVSSDKYPGNEEMTNKAWQSRWDWNSFEQVELIADQVTRFTGKRFLPVDNGDCVSPRYDVAECPTVGDEVSYTFNGDYYPCGKIVSISKSLRVIKTDSGKAFYRKGQRAAWLNRGMWSLVPGTIRRWNPEF